MDHTFHLAAVLGFNRQTVAAVAHSDQIVLQFAADTLGIDHTV